MRCCRPCWIGRLRESCDVTDPKPNRGIGSFDLKPRLMYNEIGYGQNILELQSR
jgi:hypothetical protein